MGAFHLTRRKEGMVRPDPFLANSPTRSGSANSDGVREPRDEGVQVNDTVGAPRPQHGVILAACDANLPRLWQLVPYPGSATDDHRAEHVAAGEVSTLRAGSASVRLERSGGHATPSWTTHGYADRIERSGAVPPRSLRWLNCAIRAWSPSMKCKSWTR